MSSTGSGRGISIPIAVSLVVVLSVAGTLSFGSMTLYLDGDGVPVASLVQDSPAAAVLSNPDPWRDSVPGLVIERGGVGPGESDPDRFQQWVGPSDGMVLEGAVAFLFSAAMKDFRTGSRGVVEAFLLDCDPAGSSCIQLARSSREIVDWSGGWGTWGNHSIEFGRIDHIIAPGRSLSIKITVPEDSDDDMWLAYGANGFPSMITSSSFSDIAIDCDFADWLDGEGGHLMIPDQGGADDFSSPARLDVTLLGVSGNLVDSFYLLMGIDDIAPQGVELAGLVDTDMDGAMDRAVTAAIDGGEVQVAIYSCDDSLSDGCGGAVLEGTYSPRSFCLGTGSGPWSQDTLLEISVPMSDLAAGEAPVIFGPLISYAGAALLTSPKDSILGATGEEYSGGIRYDPVTGESGIIDSLGPSFLVRRNTDPSAVRASQPVASTSSGPFDDAPGILLDGQTWFYMVERQGGLPVEISVNPNPAEGTVRLGFNDIDPFSAPADPVRSTITVSAASVPADAYSRALVTVIPRDGGGVPLGGGCAIVVDAGMLGPSIQAGPVHDNYDGSYSFELTATSQGTAQVVVEVEGITLSATPQIVFY